MPPGDAPNGPGTRPRVFVIDSLTGNDYSYCLCRGLQAVGADVALVTVAGRAAPFPIDFEVLDWAPAKGGSGSGARKLGSYLRYLVRLLVHVRRSSRTAPTIAHVQFLRRSSVETFYLALVRLAGARVVLTAHNVVPHEAARAEHVLAALRYRFAHQVIAHSAFVRAQLLESFPLPASKVSVVPHGNFDHYRSPTDPTRAVARGELGLEPGDAVVLFFGYIREYKGLELLLEAFPAAVEQLPSLRLVIAGQPHSNDLRARYRAQIAAGGVADRIIVHDHYIDSSQVATYFGAADLAVLPYANIYHSGVVHLANSFATPVLATDVGDFPETIEDGITGFVIEAQSRPALVDGLVRAFADPQELERIGRRALDRGVERHSWTEIARQTLAVYQA